MLWCFLAVRNTYYFVMRVFICEPLFKAYCTKYGKNLHTGVFIHWVMGKGDIIIGDNVRIDGKCSFAFSPRFIDRPTLEIGNQSGIGHGCSFVVGKRIRIGEYCMIAGGVSLFDSNGHPADPEARRAGAPPAASDVRPIEIGDNVWIGQRSIIFPGVRIGDGSIVSANSVVRGNVRPYTLVAGNPAKRICNLPRAVKTIDDSQKCDGD
jgi:acetyltransferase-like isoleucine patch superfamily enzyme